LSHTICCSTQPNLSSEKTHLLKTRIGTLQNGIDLSNSVENEYYCLKLMAAFGLPTATAKINVFGKTVALVIERFDRRWTDDGRLLRLPQEDFCQALSCPPGLKYQNHGGPGIVEGLNLLKGSDTPTEDQKAFLKAQVLFWLIGATDGHAKNFSIFLGRGGRFMLTPMYDVVTAQPSLVTRQIERKQMKLAMFLGDSQHYRLDEIKGRHFIQTTERAGLPASLAKEVLAEVAQTVDAAITILEKQVPRGFPEYIHEAVKAGLTKRLKNL
jgi:serine/threonine-protein kinase HipA